MGPVVKAMEARGDLTVHRVDLETTVEAFPQHPDWLLLLGDRHELLLPAHWAIRSRVPIAHIHGGETTLGAFDDKIRNAVSQLADLHFTAAQPFTNKLILMGIKPETIHTVGAPGLDDLETDPACEFDEGFFLVTLHPETAGKIDNVGMGKALTDALDRFPERRIIITASNNDPGGERINRTLHDWVVASRYKRSFIGTLGRRRYLTAMKHAAVVIGNSSSGIIEAPAMGTPTVNIGRRQEGRPMATSIFSTDATADSIAFGIECSLRSNGIRANDDIPPPYGYGGASHKIAEKLASWPTSN